MVVLFPLRSIGPRAACIRSFFHLMVCVALLASARVAAATPGPMARPDDARLGNQPAFCGSTSAAPTERTGPTVIARSDGFGGRHNGEPKADPVYGGGRGRDPYGRLPDEDPYRGPNLRGYDDREKNKPAPANAAFHGKKEKEEKEPAEYGSEDKPRMSREDRDEERRANKAARVSGGGSGGDSGSSDRE